MWEWGEVEDRGTPFPPSPQMRLERDRCVSRVSVQRLSCYPGLHASSSSPTRAPADCSVRGRRPRVDRLPSSCRCRLGRGGRRHGRLEDLDHVAESLLIWLVDEEP
jgi:hypothetical protein